MFQMPELTKVEQKKAQEAGVGLILVFGSQVTGNKHPGSDVDVGVVFSDRKQKEEDPVGVYGLLTDIMSGYFPEQELDIVYLHEAPLSLQHRAVMDGELIFASSPAFAADYKEYAMKMYYDFKQVEDEFNEALIS